MANIPTEVVESCILPRLPVKSLFRFKCVSNSWKTLISSSKFLHLHQRHANRLLLVGPTILQVHNLDSPVDKPFLCLYPCSEQLPQLPGDKITVLASCEFFVLVGSWMSFGILHLFLLNPCTLGYHRIPLEGILGRGIGSPFVKYGLYFDEANDDCKVVKIFDFHLSDELYGWEIKIYNSKTKLWRLIENDLISGSNYRTDLTSTQCVNNNLLYVIFHSFIQLRIRCFDIQTEQWTKDIMFPHKLILPELRVLDGSLYVLGVNASDDEEVRTRNYCMWGLNESGRVKESWVKLMNIVPKDFREPKYLPIAFRKGSRHELLCRRFCDSELFWYDLRYKIATRAEFDGVARGASLYSNVDHICKESLICFHGGERIE